MSPDEKSAITFDDSNFEAEVLQSPGPVLVDFWAEWCGPCRMIGPAVEELAGEFQGQAKVGKVNVDEHPQLAQRYGVQGIPTLLIFQDGEVVDRVVGAAPKQMLSEKLQARVTT